MLGYGLIPKSASVGTPVRPISFGSTGNPGTTTTPYQEGNEQENLIAQQYAQMRKSLGAQGQEEQRQIQEGIDREQAAGGGFGGAATKIRENAIAQVGAQQAGEQAQLGAGEAGALAGVKAAKAQRAFEAEEAGLTREQQQKQFEASLGMTQQQLDFAKQSFEQELGENKNTNIVNAIIAAKKGGLIKNVSGDSFKSWLENLYGGRAPNLFMTQNTISNPKYNPVAGF